jgi:hypothetical protein
LSGRAGPSVNLGKSEDVHAFAFGSGLFLMLTFVVLCTVIPAVLLVRSVRYGETRLRRVARGAAGTLMVGIATATTLVAVMVLVIALWGEVKGPEGTLQPGEATNTVTTA